MNYICHFGVKGMHWGVIRKDPSGSGNSHISKVAKRVSDHKKVSNEKLIATYKGQGYNQKQAEILADGERRARRALMVAGGVVLTAAVAYGAYRYHDYAKDSLIKAGHVIQTVHTEAAEDRLAPGNPFYAAFTKQDKTIYASKVFSHFKDESQVTKFFTEDGIKVASYKSSEKAFLDLYRENQDFKQYVGETITGRYGAKADELTPKQLKRTYLQFGKMLVRRSGGADGIDHDTFHNIFYDKLKKSGYGGLIDINDSVIEGFTYKPTIIFDNTQKHIISTTKATSEELGAARATKGAYLATKRAVMRKPYNSFTVQALSAAGAMSTVSYLTNLKGVTDYKVEHPNTKLSDKEILQKIAYQY